MKKISILIFLFITNFALCQDIDSFSSYRKLAKFQIKELKKEGALVLRLTLHKKNADLYRKAGKTKIADRIEKKLINRNTVLAKVFLDSSFDFCKVYVIEAKNYKRVLAGEKSGYFLNENLEIDSSITLNTNIVYFMEVGNVYEAQKEIVNGEKKTSYSSNPSVQDVLVIKDRELKQLVSPFPFYVRLSSVNTNINDVSVKLNPDDNPVLKYATTESYKKFVKAKFKFSKANILLSTRAYYINKRLLDFYFKSLTAAEKKSYLR